MELNIDKRQLVMEWYELYYDDMYRFIWLMLGDKQCCEDFVHDTFVRAYTAYDRFDHRSSVKTWLFSIAKHLVLDEIRKRKRNKHIPVLSFEKELSSSFNLEKYIENKEAVNQLFTAIQQLKPNYRMVIILMKVEEYSTKETANILGWSEVKVRKTLSRALQSLRKRNTIQGGEQVEQSL
ncbi:RNA polymerase sigma factor [Heyndrickxia oleronia]|uniref:RNA polymerase sigma factor n=1 Tax=Heyndrickxia oleronia TaxID=38875 RepID=UPI001B080641|nr:RNA polymerase sigma factor [Heyndrickxia oleronia]GIN40797.1 DNA-directed RNA polymerase sigma-70 factor [Heyndrickxia oleronia]